MKLLDFLRLEALYREAPILDGTDRRPPRRQYRIDRPGVWRHAIVPAPAVAWFFEDGARREPLPRIEVCETRVPDPVHGYLVPCTCGRVLWHLGFDWIAFVETDHRWRADLRRITEGLKS